MDPFFSATMAADLFDKRMKAAYWSKVDEVEDPSLVDDDSAYFNNVKRVIHALRMASFTNHDRQEYIANAAIARQRMTDLIASAEARPRHYNDGVDLMLATWMMSQGLLHKAHFLVSRSPFLAKAKEGGAGFCALLALFVAGMTSTRVGGKQATDKLMNGVAFNRSPALGAVAQTIRADCDYCSGDARRAQAKLAAIRAIIDGAVDDLGRLATYLDLAAEAIGGPRPDATEAPTPHLRSMVNVLRASASYASGNPIDIRDLPTDHTIDQTLSLMPSLAHAGARGSPRDQAYWRRMLRNDSRANESYYSPLSKRRDELQFFVTRVSAEHRTQERLERALAAEAIVVTAGLKADVAQWAFKSIYAAGLESDPLPTLGAAPDLTRFESSAGDGLALLSQLAASAAAASTTVMRQTLVLELETEISRAARAPDSPELAVVLQRAAIQWVSTQATADYVQAAAADFFRALGDERG